MRGKHQIVAYIRIQKKQEWGESAQYLKIKKTARQSAQSLKEQTFQVQWPKLLNSLPAYISETLHYSLGTPATWN